MNTNISQLIPNKPLFLFDVDGTLTESRKPIDNDHKEEFIKFSEENNVILITGSDFEKTHEQLGDHILDNIDFVFCCMGNELRYKKNYLIYSKIFEVDPDFKDKLNIKLTESEFGKNVGNHFELRPGMLNFSVVGRAASHELREEYYNWDLENDERKQLSDYINNNYPDLEAAIGGQISIDIFPRGNDKSQAIDYILNYLYPGEIQQIVFFGDKTEPGGNDYSIIKKAETCEQLVCHTVTGPHETFEILKKSYFSP
tara:strand:- start:47586 stop:48353 length:768 start_codon:yes stop_codon:yes gene_type:complete